MIERFADDWSGLHAEVAHHLVPVDRRADALEVLFRGEARDPLLKRVHRNRELARAHLVAGRRVAPNETIQLVEKGPGVSHVSPHRGVRPTGSEGVEAQMQLDERRDLLDELRGVTQRLQALARHLRALDLVMVEGLALW